MATEPIALQLYTVRDLTKNDFLGTLSKLAESGFQAVEFAGYGGHTAAEVRKHMDAVGLVAAGAHVGYKLWDEAFDATLADVQVLGCEYAVIPWLPPELRPTNLEQTNFLANKFNGWAGKVKAAGIRLGYHNHDFEFQVVDGKTVYDRLAEAAPIDLQLDVYWAQFIGADPLALVRKYEGRMPQLHVKELAQVDGKYRDAPFGEGIIDWDALLPVAAASGTKWYIVEQDTPNDPLADSITSLNNARTKLKKLGIG